MIHRVLDLSSPASRRRFFLDRVLRRASRVEGAHLASLMDLPGQLHDRHRLDMINEIFDKTPVCLIGAHAAAAYAPERNTQDVDIFTGSENYALACKQLQANGYRKDADLAFPQTALALFGSRWIPQMSGVHIDLISTEQKWSDEVFQFTPSVTTSGDRVMPLAYLVLMKLDAARSIDQGDLSRMLGRLTMEEVAEVVEVISRHYGHDPAAIEDVHQYAEVGRWEYGSQNPKPKESG